DFYRDDASRLQRLTAGAIARIAPRAHDLTVSIELSGYRWRNVLPMVSNRTYSVWTQPPGPSTAYRAAGRYAIEGAGGKTIESGELGSEDDGTSQSESLQFAATWIARRVAALSAR